MKRSLPGFAAAVGFSAVITAFVIWLRIGLFPHQIVPLAHGLPLMICLWHRRRSVLWSMAVVLAATSILKAFFLLPSQVHAQALTFQMDLTMSMVSIVIMAIVIDLVILGSNKIEEKNYQLNVLNDDLEKANFELSQRDEELTRQNEELSVQAEELEQQREELQQQNEEQDQQAGELRNLNAELADREQAMQILMGATRWTSSELQEREVLSRICEAAVRVVHGASYAAIAARTGDLLVMRGAAGYRSKHPEACVPYGTSFASLVIERGATAYVQDTNQRPDLTILQPEGEPPVRSVLSSPLRVAGETIGVLNIFSTIPRDWSHEDFRIIEWLAAQSSQVIEAMQLQQELDHRRQAAEEESVRKTRFLAAVSHDVRTPANAISLLAELIVRSSSDPAEVAEVPQLARDLQANSKALVELVSDVLDVARFDSGQSQLQTAPFELTSVIQTEVRQLMPLAIEKGLHLTTQSLHEPLWIDSDRIKVARVISNLIANAIKFTEHGSVKVICRLEPSDIRLDVVDTGVGIPPEHQSRIFDEFFQLRNPERDRGKGAGLGLAICQRLVAAMGGTLSVQSEHHVGSTFTFTLPRKVIVAAPNAEGPLVSGRAGVLAGLRVLLVEDHDMTRRAASSLLAGEGATVFTAENGRAALHAIAHDKPHVLLLDLMLPDMDGAEILRQLREKRPAELRSIFAVSGDVSPVRQQQVLALGADALVAKPLEIGNLVGMLREQIAPELDTI